MSDPREQRGHWLWGSVRELARAPHVYPAEIAWRGGGLASFRVLHRRVIAISDPALIRQVLVTRHDRYDRSFHYRSNQAIVGKSLLSTEGDFWLGHRRQMRPAFRHEHLPRLAAATREATAEMLDGWAARQRDDGTVGLGAEMQALTIGVMGRALLSARLDAEEAARFGAAVRDSLALVRRRNNAKLRLPLWMPTPANRRLTRTRDVLDRFIMRHIDARAALAQPAAADILAALIASRHPETGAPFDAPALRDETKTLFIAGFETTATALTWTLYLLARHPEIAEAWHDELDRVLGGGTPDWSDIDRLPVTRAIIDEALRLYPPVYSIPRQCVAVDELAGYEVRLGDIILVSIYGAHLSPAAWQEPERFRPERFAPGADWDPHAMMPFGVGKHACIGGDFAIAEMLVALAMIGQRFRVALADPAPVEMVARVTLAPAREIPIRIEARTAA